jgi:Fe-S-cluster containining protein
MGNWRCVKLCGACCHLDPAERPGLDEYLSPTELEEYLNLVGEDGWCINFDQETRECRIYDDRPRFCRVKPDIFADLYGVEAPEFNDFAIQCCLEQIEAVYGDDSIEMSRYQQAVIDHDDNIN